MKQSEIERNPYKTDNDQITMNHEKDTRKPKLTLKALNNLRKMREMRRFEELQHQEFVERIYGLPEEKPGF